MEILQINEDEVIVRTSPSPFSELDIERRHEERMAELKKRFGDDLWDVPLDIMLKAREEMSGDYREKDGQDRQSGKFLPDLIKRLSIERQAVRWEINLDDLDGRHAVVERIRTEEVA